VLRLIIGLESWPLSLEGFGTTVDICCLHVGKFQVFIFTGALISIVGCLFGCLRPHSILADSSSKSKLRTEGPPPSRPRLDPTRGIFGDEGVIETLECWKISTTSLSPYEMGWTAASRRLALATVMVGNAVAFESRGAVLVTGSTDGIGVTTAKNLAAQGYDVLVHGRDEGRLKVAEQEIQSFARSTNSRVRRLPAADLASVQGARQVASDVIRVCAEEGLDLKVVMNNAGVYSEERIITGDGTELTFAVNVVAPFVITSRLLPALLKGGKKDRRIVLASSISQCGNVRDWDDMAYERRSYSAHGAYSESKLLDAMLTFEFAQRLTEKGAGINTITCNCLDPGTVNTKMLLAGWGPIGINVEDALDQTWLCSSDEVKGVTGKYYTYQHERSASRSAYSPTERQHMWSILSALAPDEAALWDFDWYSSN
jgi:NAD(P)-dependent dehydrogenase (short-subunit alcohol dehydrogenase family)